MSLKLTTIASGSSGNCAYIGTENTKILIDAGISGIKIENALKEIDVDVSNLDAIFVTHEHSDHIYGVGVLSRKYNLPIYATEGTWAKMDKIGDIKHKNKNIIYPNENIILNDLSLKPFLIPHDALEPVAYTIKWNNKKIAIATDMGHITKNIIENLRYCDALILESNHDINMVKNSNYPISLKERVLGKFGHISNEISAKLLACIMNQNLKDVILAHISKENNNPDLAYITFKNILEEFGIIENIHINIHIAKDYGVSKIIELN